ncbi:MAG TPA: NAD(P)H-dependent oxidoreductase [Allosphingosinicella sp.]|nr:NAD(P)H-dependent oxidoreductase [Allosphingosinicella sp.]
MNILIVTSSAQGAASVSNRLARGFAEQLEEARPGSRITWRDVGAQPLPHLTEETVAGIRAEAQSDAEIAARDISDELLAEVRAADLVVIASPMYNFGISSTLKTWFDYVLRPRVAFRYSERGPEGLLGNRKVVVIESRAGKYEGAADLQEAHLRTMLTFAGLDDLTFVRAEGLAFGPEAAEAAIGKAADQLTALAREDLPLAA